MQERPRGFERLLVVIQQLSAARDLLRVQEIVRTAARELTSSDGATFVLRDGNLCFYADEDAIAPLWKGLRFPMSACVSGWVMNERQATAIPDIYDDPRVPTEAYRPTFVKSMAMMPIRTELPVGAIGVYWATPHVPTDEEMSFLAALADSTSIAIENVRLFEELQEGLRARGEALARAEHELAERRRAEAELQAAEAQLRQAQKMEAVGRLAGGVAHDFNNILSVILSYATVLADELPVDDAKRSDVDEICKAGERAAALTKQLLAFSRQQMREPKVHDLNAILRGMKSMLTPLLGAAVEIELVTAPGLEHVLVDEGQMEQVAMNLVINARDAMQPRGGKIRVETANVVITSDDVADRRYAVGPGRYVKLAVSDTGHGMDAETCARIFEPFFTTKAEGKGTGLGLSTVYGIVAQSGGKIWVESTVGAGTTFEVYLPPSDGPAVTAAKPSPVVRVSRGKETILIVEDDDQLRTVVHDILARSGYRVLIARSAGEALLHWDGQAAPIDLLLTDVVMPKRSGVDLARRITEIHAPTRVLFMSGYAEDSSSRQGLLDATGFLQKPFTPAALLLKVRQVLDAPRDVHVPANAT